MVELWDIMIRAFCACVVLAGIHGYFGLHVLKREVIFVDLALAQLAALGAAFGALLGFGLHSPAGYYSSLAFALAGAILLSFARRKQQLIQQEVIVGVVYVVSAAAMVLVLSRFPEGGEEIKSLLVGHLLFVSWNEIIYITAVYLVISIIHFIYRKQFFAVSEGFESASQAGVNVRKWDFLFYATFAFVVTSSVEVAGILLVFSLLVIPAACALCFVKSFKGKLFLAWTFGFFGSLIGIIFSYVSDLPTGATLVVVLGALFALCFIYRALQTKGEFYG